MISDKGAVHEQLIRIGIDTSKSVHVCTGWIRPNGRCCAGSFDAAKCLSSLQEGRDEDWDGSLWGGASLGARTPGSGTRGRSAPPQYVKPYVERNKNDAADAEAICEAMSRPRMRFVPVKTRISRQL